MLNLGACRRPPAPNLVLSQPHAPLQRPALQRKPLPAAQALPLAAPGLRSGHRRRQQRAVSALPNTGAGAASVEVPPIGVAEEHREQRKRGLAAVLSPLSDRRANGKLLALCACELGRAGYLRPVSFLLHPCAPACATAASALPPDPVCPPFPAQPSLRAAQSLASVATLMHELYLPIYLTDQLGCSHTQARKRGRWRSVRMDVLKVPTCPGAFLADRQRGTTASPLTDAYADPCPPPHRPCARAGRWATCRAPRSCCPRRRARPRAPWRTWSPPRAWSSWGPRSPPPPSPCTPRRAGWRRWAAPPPASTGWPLPRWVGGVAAGP